MEGDLIPFHFGTLGDEPRAAVEAHLQSCPRCLQAYLEVKRAIERGDAAQPQPSALLRARLRADVSTEFARPRRSWRVWGAVAATLVAVTLVGLYTRTPPVEAPVPSLPVNNEPVDSARPMTASAQLRFL